ncbi:hypothetical protein BC828DRAFT_379849 [Blastocladiella britannica]|nr:hypothetical protein BC828DRAFT_379849 [Blastocladiella britannica]
MPAPLPTTSVVPSSHEPIKIPDASTKGGQFRIAGRRLISAFLHQVLVLDTDIACFDVHVVTNMVALCASKLVHMYSLERNAVTMSLGQTAGHRLNIRCCGFNATGNLLITGGDDGRVVVWSLAKQRPDKIFNAHAGLVYSVRFTGDDSQFLSSGDDGKVVLWERGPGAAMYSTVLHHPTPVRSFAFADMHGSRLLAGRTDGTIDVWDTARVKILDSILPESDWQERELLSQLSGAGHAAILAMFSTKLSGAAGTGQDESAEHHSGSILHVALASSSVYLATCSTDKTCKLWEIHSYLKEDADVFEDPTWTDPTQRINVWDETLAGQLVDSEMHVGNVDIKLGYHADLRHTLKHEDPVICAVFTSESDIVITSSLDCTIRFWSVRKGNLLFQINTPSCARHLIVDANNTLYAACGVRMLTFRFKAAKERDTLVEMEEQRLMALDDERKRALAGIDPSNRFKSLLTQVREDDGAEGTERFTFNEVRTLMAQGSLLSTSLDTLIEDNALKINSNQLRTNMELYGVKAASLLKVIVQNEFHPSDMLAAFAAAQIVASKQTCPVNELYTLVKRSESIREFMLRAGYRPLSRQQPERVFPLKFDDFRPFRSLDDETPDRTMQSMALSGMGGYSSAEEDDMLRAGIHGEGGTSADGGGGSSRVGSRGGGGAAGGRLYHYIPSEAVTLDRMTSAARPRLRKLYLEPASTRPPTTPLRFTQVSSRGGGAEQLVLGAIMGDASAFAKSFGGMTASSPSSGGFYHDPAAPRTQQQQQPQSPKATWTSSGPQRFAQIRAQQAAAAAATPPARPAQLALHLGSMFRGRGYTGQPAGDGAHSTFEHPVPDGGLGGERRGRSEQRATGHSSLPPPTSDSSSHHWGASSDGPPHHRPLAIPESVEAMLGGQVSAGGLNVRRLGAAPDDADIEDYDEDDFDYSLIDKAADAYRGRRRRRRRKGRQSRSTSIGAAGTAASRSRSRTSSQTPSRSPSPLVRKMFPGLSVLVSNESLGPNGMLEVGPGGPLPQHGGHVRVGHIYAQPIIMSHGNDGDDQLATALKVGRPVQVNSTRARPTFTN